jgi:hypothetical protein
LKLHALSPDSTLLTADSFFETKKYSLDLRTKSVNYELLESANPQPAISGLVLRLNLQISPSLTREAAQRTPERRLPRVVAVPAGLARPALRRDAPEVEGDARRRDALPVAVVAAEHDRAVVLVLRVLVEARGARVDHVDHPGLRRREVVRVAVLARARHVARALTLKQAPARGRPAISWCQLQARSAVNRGHTSRLKMG